MSQQGIYGLCYRTKLEKLTFNYCNFYHLQGLWLNGRLKMHFLQVECKSSSMSKTDPHLHLQNHPGQNLPGKDPLIKAPDKIKPPRTIEREFVQGSSRCNRQNDHQNALI